VPAVIAGKPERIIFEIAREALTGCERIAVIGDHLIADIAGARRAGSVTPGTVDETVLARLLATPDS
jgi:ribonucleotide monophosphatase NagD (HAD superfamily)